MASFKILESRRIPARDPKRAGDSDTMIVYAATDGPGVFTAVIALAQPDDAAIKKAIAEDQAARSRLAGKTFSV